MTGGVGLAGRQEPGRIWQLFKSFLAIGAFTFGGGYAMVSLIRVEVVERRGWLSELDFVDTLAVAQASPGAVAVNTATFVGYRLGGVPGAAAAVAGAVLPSFLIVLPIVYFFFRIEHVPAVVRFFKGLRPAVFALISLSAWDLGRAAVDGWTSALIGVAAVAAMLLAGIHPILVIVVAAVSGVLLHHPAKEVGE